MEKLYRIVKKSYTYRYSDYCVQYRYKYIPIWFYIKTKWSPSLFSDEATCKLFIDSKRPSPKIDYLYY